ncbi:uncharacterized protein LOC130451507 [Diorhabda sublineata]|uniref:uncharacterized protein LOC130451507 n=1 Tax=Diorhabda sublineata TaxID=1163346 RepID=UPI0024E15EC8|nr:uncharacterized protein LOC130451507 [Diorhabda sublineata]
MARTIFLSLAILCFLVTKCMTQNPFTGGNLGTMDYYAQCASKLEVENNRIENNREAALCIQRCVFEKDGTLNKQGVLMKSKFMEYLFTALFNNNNKVIASFNQCLGNLLPSGIIKACWDIDKLLYCLVSNSDVSLEQQQYIPEAQFPPQEWYQPGADQMVPMMEPKLPFNSMRQEMQPILMGSRFV